MKEMFNHLFNRTARPLKPLLTGGAVVGVLLLLSCSSIDCPVQNTVAMNYGIIDANGESMSLADTLYVWTQRSDGKDTLLLNRGVGLTTFSLPVSYSHPEDMLVFYKVNPYGLRTLDTLWIKKDNIPHFESVDCAAHFFHRLTAVRATNHGIDSVGIANANVNYDQSYTHLRIRFK